MKTYTIVSAIVVTLFSGLTFVPALDSQAAYFPVGSLVVGLSLLVKALIAPAGRPKAHESASPPVSVEAEVPVAVPASAHQAEAEVLAVLGTLQAKGRLIDFLMDDVSGYTDAQVGAAARVVHQGCQAALAENFEIVPVTTAKEGSAISVPADASADEFRLVGNVSGEPPFTGTLVHKGWKTTRINLPRILKIDDDRLPAIAPAQVELK